MSKAISGGQFEVINSTTDVHESQGKMISTKAGADLSTGLSSLFFGQESFQDQEEDDDDVPHQYQHEELQMMAGFGSLNDLYLDVVSPPFHACSDEISRIISQEAQPLESNPENKSHSLFPSSSFRILKNLRKEIGTHNGRKIQLFEKKTYTTTSPSPLWTHYLIELAAGKFIQSSTSIIDAQQLSAIGHPSHILFSCLSKEHVQGVRLLLDLLSCAEKVRNHEFDSASRGLEECRKLSSRKTNAIHRLVYHFSEALCEKIDREIGRLKEYDDMSEKWSTPSSSMVAFYSKFPFMHILGFSSIQLIVDSVSQCRKIHLIDLGVRCGSQQVVLMEALAARTESPVEHLKITAVTMSTSKIMVEKTGNRLKTLAESLNLSFSFQMTMLEEITHLLLDVDEEETIVFHAAFILNEMISKQRHLETLVRVLKRLSPRAMIISKAEANINSPVFVNRFVEALFFYGAHFDWIEDRLKDDPGVREFAESQLFGPRIRNIVAAEGEERKCRIVGIDVWRAFFARFGMVETEMTKSSLQHAALISKTFECGDSCTLDMDGKSLIVGWKGSPMYALSSWNFQKQGGP